MAESSIGSRLLVVGAASRDVDPDDERGWRLGGTVVYAALAAARLGVPVRALIGVDAAARGAHELDLLREAGVDVALTDLSPGPTFENVQYGEARRQIVHEPSSRIPVEALPESWRASQAVLLGPVAAELGTEWAGAFAPAALVALAWQGLLRDLRRGLPVLTLPLRSDPLVRRASVLFVSAEDVAGGGAPLDELLADGQELFVTHGGLGAVHLRRAAGRRTIRYVPPRPRREALDTTGAGDVFLAAYVAARLAAPQLVGTAGEWRLDAVAAAAASLHVGARHLPGVPTLRELCAVLVRPLD